MKNANTQAVTADTILLKKVDLFDAIDVAHVQPVLFINLASPLEKKFSLFLKRAFDVAVSSILIIVLLTWIIPLIALVIKLGSKGPVFFLQKRNKRNGLVFTCIKFRTMIVNPQADIMAACADDDRITRVGRFLRHHHLDELPQLFNVFWGDMSLIGPRPHMISDNQRYEQLVEQYNLRHKVKPGITGLAQASGHYGIIVDENEMKQRVQLDLQYIQNWSVKMDIQILYKTFLRTIAFNQRNK
jgi:putative colanic acid biosynthesis UDP-glucose lipid carrier transferase